METKLDALDKDASNGNSLEAHAFLQLLATFDIASDFNKEDTISTGEERKKLSFMHGLHASKDLNQRQNPHEGLASSPCKWHHQAAAIVALNFHHFVIASEKKLSKPMREINVNNLSSTSQLVKAATVSPVPPRFWNSSVVKPRLLQG